MTENEQVPASTGSADDDVGASPSRSRTGAEDVQTFMVDDHVVRAIRQENGFYVMSDDVAEYIRTLDVQSQQLHESISVIRGLYDSTATSEARPIGKPVRRRGLLQGKMRTGPEILEAQLDADELAVWSGE